MVSKEREMNSKKKKLRERWKADSEGSSKQQRRFNIEQ
jgi:hypothetical protein